MVVRVRKDTIGSNGTAGVSKTVKMLSIFRPRCTVQFVNYRYSTGPSLDTVMLLLT